MILKNGQKFNPYSSFEDNGINYPPNWYFYATLEEKNLLGFTEVPDPITPDPRFFYINTDGTIKQKSIDVCKEIIKDELASIRWENESAGIIYNDILYVTDSQSKVNYLGALQKSLLDPNYTVLWKAKTITNPQSSIFINLSAPEMVTIANAAINYVTACFENENNLVLQINNITKLEELTGFDLQTGWPTRYYS